MTGQIIQKKRCLCFLSVKILRLNLTKNPTTIAKFHICFGSISGKSELLMAFDYVPEGSLKPSKLKIKLANSKKKKIVSPYTYIVHAGASPGGVLVPTQGDAPEYTTYLLDRVLKNANSLLISQNSCF